MKQFIFIIEDDEILLKQITLLLTTEGFEVTSAKSITEARKGLSPKFNLILLDWMLPDGQGIDYLREIRKSSAFASTPILMVSARGELLDKVLGLESGSNDYITKPFEPRELVARIRTHLRVNETLKPTPKGDVTTYGSIKIDTHAHRSWSNDKEVTLTKLEFELLKLLTENPNKVFSRDELLNRVWGFENFPSTRTVDTHVFQLRQYFGEEYFETVRGVGYRFKI